jgi:hypothetical protein
MENFLSRGCWSASAGARARWTVGVDLLSFLHFFGGGRVVPVDAGLWFSLSVSWSARCLGGCVMSGDSGGNLRFPVGSVSSSAFGVVFSKVAFLHSSAFLDRVLCSWWVFGVTWAWGLWDAELIDVDSLEWELSGSLTFGKISVVFSKVTFLHSLSFLDLVLCLWLIVCVTWVSELQDSDLVGLDSLEWELAEALTFGIVADIIDWSIMSCDRLYFVSVSLATHHFVQPKGSQGLCVCATRWG